jgi:hypothetical protein
MALIGLHLVLGLLYDWATPIFETPDEGYHFAVIHWIGLGNGLPIQKVGERHEWEQEGSQPPLYQALAAGLTFWIDMYDWAQTYVINPYSKIGVPGTSHNVNLFRHTADQRFPYHGTALAVHLARWFSLGLSAVTIWLTHRLALKVFPGRERLALLAAVLVALNPMTLAVNASVNNDNLLMLLSTAALLVIVDFMRPSVPRYASRAAGLGLLLGLLALTKVSGLVLWPVAALGVGWGAWKARDWRRFLLGGAIITGLALLVSGWWFWRNHDLYGEWLGLNTMVAIAGPRLPPITVWQLIRDEWASFWLSYWGIFGTFTIRVGDWVYDFFDVLTLWALVGGAWAVFRLRRWPRPELLLLALFCALTLVGVVRWTLQTFASQGRLMFGAIAPLSIFMAASLEVMANWKLQIRPLSSVFSHLKIEVWDFGFWILTSLLALIAALIPVLYIAPRYVPPPVIAEVDLPSDLRPVHARFGDGIELIGYVADDTPRFPGSRQLVTLYWRALGSMRADYSLALSLTGRGGAVVGKIDTWPGGGNLPTSQWMPGAIYADTYLIPIDPQAETPSLLNLYLWFWGSKLEDALPIATPSGDAPPSVKVAVGRVVAASAPRFSPMTVEGSTFEHGIRLLGVDVEPGGRVALYWQAEGLVPGDYTVFLHLLDAAGMEVAPPADAPPLAGDWPTSAWIPGQPFADVHQFDLPTHLPPGPYSLRLGLYNPASDARLTAFRKDGTEWPDDIVVIEHVEIK